MSDRTEESILNSIPDLQDSSGGDSGTGDSGQAETSAQPTEGGGDGQTSAQPTQSGGEGSAGQQSAQQQVRRRHDGLVEVPNPDNPNTRDLVDPITGRTVAKGGIERRVFEEGQRHARENNALKQQLTTAQRQLSSINEVTQEAVRLNVAPQDQVIAIRVMADFMRDPVRTLQGLVEEVKSKGYPIPFLEQGVTPGMDMNAMQRMIDNKLAPITQQRQQEQVQAQARQQAEADLNNFLQENEEANSNLDVLGEMLQAQPGLSLQSAYTKMIRWSHEHGLDWTQPLKAQIAQQRQQPSPQQPTPQQRPLPGRRSAGGQTATPVGNGAVAQYNENASWADIIRQSMQDHGVTL